jgi:hypothetical protein
VALHCSRVPPTRAEGDDEQKRKQHLNAGQRDPDLVQQLDQLAVDALARRLAGEPGVFVPILHGRQRVRLGARHAQARP